MDKEYVILNYIEKKRNVTQRQIAEEVGLSLGTVNILLKKMIREGLVKVENIPASRVLYMLTPHGIQEKLKKAYAYVQIHYAAIERTKSEVRSILGAYNPEHTVFRIEVMQPELDNMIREAAAELGVLITEDLVSCHKNIVLLHDNVATPEDVGGTVNILSELAKRKKE